MDTADDDVRPEGSGEQPKPEPAKTVRVVKKRKRALGRSLCDKTCRICRKPCETPLFPEDMDQGRPK